MEEVVLVVSPSLLWLYCIFWYFGYKDLQRAVVSSSIISCLLYNPSDQLIDYIVASLMCMLKSKDHNIHVVMANTKFMAEGYPFVNRGLTTEKTRPYHKNDA